MKFLFCLLFLLNSLIQARPVAFKQGSILVDAEAQDLFDSLLDCLKRVDAKQGHSYNVVLVADPEFNAFVAGDQNIFLCKGTLDRLETLGQLAFILFHEIGHLQGHHGLHQSLQQQQDLYRIVPLILGSIGSWKTGQMDSGVLTLMGHPNPSCTARTSRAHETIADQFAYQCFVKLGWNPKAFLEVLEILSAHDCADFPSYLRSHPMAQERMDFIQQKLRHAKTSYRPFPPDLEQSLKRVKIKSVVLTHPLVKAKNHVQSLKDPQLRTYGACLLAQRCDEPLKALAHLTELEKSWRHDPFLGQIRAELYYTLGQFEKASTCIKRALAQKRTNMILAMDCATVLLAQNRFQEVVTLLEPFINRNTMGAHSLWQLLARAYGKLGKKGELLACQGELALLERQWKKASLLAQKALLILIASHPFYNRMSTIQESIQWEKKS